MGVVIIRTQTQEGEVIILTPTIEIKMIIPFHPTKGEVIILSQATDAEDLISK